MSEYLILIYGDEARWDANAADLFQEVMDGHNAFAEKHGDRVKGGKALQQTGTATSVREGVVTDGAFAETKEALGGYYLVEADDLDQAIAIAKDVPTPFGGVEVRPVMVFE